MSFSEKFGFKVFAGDASQNWLILKNGNHVIGLFQGMFEKNILTFNPGWDSNAQKLPTITDVRELQRQKAQGWSCNSRQTKAQRGRPASSLWILTETRSSSISTFENANGTIAFERFNAGVSLRLLCCQLRERFQMDGDRVSSRWLLPTDRRSETGERCRPTAVVNCFSARWAVFDLKVASHDCTHPQWEMGSFGTNSRRAKIAVNGLNLLKKLTRYKLR